MDTQDYRTAVKRVIETYAKFCSLPDDNHQRLKTLAEMRGMSINQLLNEMTTLLLADFDAETRFRLRAARGRGKTERGLALLRKAME